MHETKFSGLSQVQLSCLFHSDYWGKLTPQDRLELCQEAHNRYADEHSMERCKVEPKEMFGKEYGYYNPETGRLALNESILRSGELTLKDGSTQFFPGSNAETLNTLYHETSHAYDNQLCRAVEDRMEDIPCNEQIIRDAESRGLDIDLIRASDQIYLSNDRFGQDFYRAQDCEKRAYENGESETEKIFRANTAILGADEQYDAYQGRLAKENTYEESLANLEMITGDPDFKENLDEQTKALYFNDSMARDPSTMTASQLEAQRILLATDAGQRCFQNNLSGSGNIHYSPSNHEETNRTGPLIASAEGTEQPKVLRREITPEVLASRQADMDELLGFYRDNLKEQGLNDEQINPFLESEREKMQREYHDLDHGVRDPYIYHDPLPGQWPEVAACLAAGKVWDPDEEKAKGKIAEEAALEEERQEETEAEGEADLAENDKKKESEEEEAPAEESEETGPEDEDIPAEDGAEKETEKEEAPAEESEETGPEDEEVPAEDMEPAPEADEEEDLAPMEADSGPVEGEEEPDMTPAAEADPSPSKGEEEPDMTPAAEADPGPAGGEEKPDMTPAAEAESNPAEEEEEPDMTPAAEADPGPAEGEQEPLSRGGETEGEAAEEGYSY